MQVEPSKYGLGLSSRIVWSVDLHHVYHWRRLVGLREVGLIEVVDMAKLGMVGEKMVHGVLTD